MDPMIRSSDHFLFYNQLNPNQNELKELLILLTEDSNKRSEILKSLRKCVKKSQNFLPNFQQNDCFEAILQVLKEDKKRPQVICECLWLVVDLIPNITHSLDTSLAPILPEVVPLLGHESADVRRAALRLLHVQMRHTLNLQKSLKSFVQFGLEARDPHVRKGTVLALPLLIGEEFQNENLFLLVESLSTLLVGADSALFYPVFLALQRLHAILGKTRFHEYLSRVSAREARELYESVFSRNNSADNDQDSKERATFLFTDSEKKVTFDHVIESEEEPEEDLYLKYNLFPSGLIWSALNGQTVEERQSAVDSVFQVVRDVPLKKLMVLQMDLFVDQFLNQLLSEENSFKVTLKALDLTEVLIERLKTSLNPFLPQLMAILTKRLGDQRTVIRDSVIRVIHQSMHALSPQHVLDELLAQKPSRNPRVREHVINRVSAAVLTFPSSEFNLPRLVFSLVPFLVDSRRSVRLAALECAAVLAQALGPSRVNVLLSAVEAVEQNCSSDGLLTAVEARLSRRQLPRVSTDGALRYFLNLQSVNGWPSDQSDLEWVLMATPSSHNGTPPKTLPLTNKRGVSNIPYDRRRSTVVVGGVPSGEALGEEEGAERRRFEAKENIERLLKSGESGERESNVEMDEEREQRMERMERRELLERDSTEREMSLRELKALSPFIGQSFNSEEEVIESYREDEQSAEAWKEYFSRFRQQLADQLIGLESDNGYHGDDHNGHNNNAHHMTRRKSDVIPLPVPFISAQDVASGPDFRPGSPVQSSSAPSTASLDKHEKEEREMVPMVPQSFVLQRSLSLPSIDKEGLEEEEEEDMIIEDVVKETEEEKSFLSDQRLLIDSKPSPMLSTPLLYTTPEVREEPDVTSEAPPLVTVQEATPLHQRRSSVAEPKAEKTPSVEKLDVWTQKDETLSSETGSEDQKKKKQEVKAATKRKSQKRAQPVARGRVSRSQSPQARRRPSRAPQHLYIKTTPAIAANANLRPILATISRKEGPLEAPHEAVKAALLALQDDAWTTKVEGMLAVVRLAEFHPSFLLKDQHSIVTQLIREVKNLRSTVSRSAIFCLGELFRLLRAQIEPEMDSMVSSLLLKSGENVSFIREDIERALQNCLQEMPQTRTALALIQSGANHRNSFVRRTCAQFVSSLVERMGATKCLLGPRDIGEHLLPAAARFVQDPSPHTRFHGRRIFQVLMTHAQFDKLLRKHVTPGTYRNICGILESIRRRGAGDRPQDLNSSSPSKNSPVFD